MTDDELGTLRPRLAPDDIANNRQRRPPQTMTPRRQVCGPFEALDARAPKLLRPQTVVRVRRAGSLAGPAVCRNTSQIARTRAAGGGERACRRDPLGVSGAGNRADPRSQEVQQVHKRRHARNRHEHDDSRHGSQHDHPNSSGPSRETGLRDNRTGRLMGFERHAMLPDRPDISPCFSSGKGACTLG